jgi:hypothetical protein
MVKKNADANATALGGILQQIGERRQRLDALDVEISTTIRTVEEHLREHLNIRVSVRLPGEEDDHPDWCELLTFGKHDGRWQLLLEAGPDGVEDQWSKTPLVSATRSKRADVFRAGHVRKLLAAAVKQLDSQIAEREIARQAQDALVAELAPVGDGAEKGAR